MCIRECVAARVHVDVFARCAAVRVHVGTGVSRYVHANQGTLQNSYLLAGQVLARECHIAITCTRRTGCTAEHGCVSALVYHVYVYMGMLARECYYRSVFFSMCICVTPSVYSLKCYMLIY